ncbi:hypothetical protein R3P38DRAFT_2606678 [Favolaschia claudopus]|uniref:Uncharacterized protein n=1 Tax=Favolaschia claudopus TaxID=2862362 RepID=A0AAW0D7W4_9AGAR
MPTTKPFSIFFLLLCLPSLALLPGSALAANPHSRRSSSFSFFWPWRRSNAARSEPSSGYFAPADGGGTMLTKAPGTFPPAGEPLNIIISGSSDPAVLKDSQAEGGFRNFFLSIGFSGECLGQHSGLPQTADLGDGNGFVNETAVLRYNYGDPALGTCQETIQGGNHFRYWTQNGKSADSGAYFFATSYEKPIAQGHDIIVNGYNLGRDWLIGNITNTPINTTALTNTSTFTGTTSYAGFVYTSSIAYVSGLLPNSSDGVNHAGTVGVNGANAVDGLVAVVTIAISTKPANATSGAAGCVFRHAQSIPALIPTTFLLLSSLLLGALAL